MQNVAIGKGNLCVQGQQGPAAIKAGRRKLSRKKSCKLLPSSGKILVHIPVSSR
jgi:hypothetical protein